ncbi:isoprenylcysteine carboxylmethyltransferase family protein [Solirubrobacter phytolaccae]|uniref:Isoprenylcysteine carboxylmethyltransferase family protein n=1 Tax=Solirubrobacter phytolaccae TaxID=1404360 RepID=A0A9X3N857_9ACTN|nr:isoprenylcysteine carboxylmethyltransferase family protein [Solirubrobacter phytolaccae]MDA0179426.1 isoprenylcysteine carboxylmethyltransferase family protein [Solirubrobacter phytolaccae]
MQRSAAAVGSSVFFAAAPGVVAGVIPWWITGWDGSPSWIGWRVLGAVVTACGAVVLLHAFARFVREGVGTPAPVAPTQRLVVGGLYRWVRNPMYIAVVSCVLGQAGVFGAWALAAYGAALMVVFFSFVRLYEEPTLAHQFGADYEAYRATVPGWFPRARPARVPPATS